MQSQTQPRRYIQKPIDGATAIAAMVESPQYPMPFGTPALRQHVRHVRR